MKDDKSRKRLRKQPKRRRVQATSAVNLPQFEVPKTAAKRRRRQKTEPVRFGLSSLKSIIFSSRWLSLALLAISIYAMVDIYQEQRFYLTYIPVEGSVAVSPEEIAEASGLAGSHVFAADPSEAARNIGAIPGIISSTVTLQWPNQVYIEVAEESPVAVWIENEKEYGITASGRLIPAIRANPTLLRIESESLPGISGSDGSDTPPELLDKNQFADAIILDRESDAAKGVQEIETSLSFIPREVLNGAMQLRELRPSIDRLYYQPSGGLSYEDGRGWRSYFGTGASMNQKLAVYETIVADLMARGIQPEYISVSNQEKPYYRPVGYQAPQEELPAQ